MLANSNNSLYSLKDLKVAIVDDNAHMRTLVGTVLGALGITNYHPAKDGNEAIDLLESTQFDLVITDWRMKPIDGITLTEMIRKNETRISPYIPIILMTGHTDRNNIFQARDAGVTEILAKPITPKALYDRIVAIIEKPRPVVRAKGYTGPCRRRIQKDWYPDERDRRGKSSSSVRARR
jgi:CheY-like chemotaxis protein